MRGRKLQTFFILKRAASARHKPSVARAEPKSRASRAFNCMNEGSDLGYGFVKFHHFSKRAANLLTALMKKERKGKEKGGGEKERKGKGRKGEREGERKETEKGEKEQTYKSYAKRLLKSRRACEPGGTPKRQEAVQLNTEKQSRYLDR